MAYVAKNEFLTKTRGGNYFENRGGAGGIKNKKVEPLSYLFSLKLTNLTKPKLMKKNVLQTYPLEFENCEK